MREEVKVKASFVTKKYELYKKKSDKTREKFGRNKKSSANFWALRGVSFEVMAGEAIGLIGTNGSGKSTLSNIISGTSMPTTGEMTVNGTTSIISISSGLNKNLTGRENIRLRCLLSGMSNKEINFVMEEIITFSELDDFIDQPIKSYSSGMKSRLGFSISVHQNPDVLIIDEALSVGDKTFNRKCVDRIHDFKSQGKTIFFVSHSLGAIEKLCDRVIWMHDGMMQSIGQTDEVITAYKEYVAWFKSLSKKEQKSYKKEQKNERKNLNIDDYYHETVSEIENNESESEYDVAKLKSLFYPDYSHGVLTMFPKLVIVLIIFAFVAILIYYVPNRPINELIFEMLS